MGPRGSFNALVRVGSHGAVHSVAVIRLPRGCVRHRKRVNLGGKKRLRLLCGYVWVPRCMLGSFFFSFWHSDKYLQCEPTRNVINVPYAARIRLNTNKDIQTYTAAYPQPSMDQA